MFKQLSEWFEMRRAARAIRNNPILHAVSVHTMKALDDKIGGLGKHASEEARGRLFAGVLQEAQDALASQHPITVTRMKLGEWVCRTAGTEVLLLDEGTGMLGLHQVEGVSGELTHHLVELSAQDEFVGELATSIQASGEEVSREALRNHLLFQNWRNHLYMQALNLVRLGLQDRADTQERDWFKPFLVSMCIFAESTYRQKIGLPPAFPEDGFQSTLKPLAHSTWLQLIEGEERDLRGAFERNWEEFNLGVSPYAGFDLAAL